MAFKMKAGKEGPMKKNFGSVLKKAIPEGAEGLNKMAKSEKGKEAVKNMGFTKDSSGALLMKKDNAPMMRIDTSAMKAMGAPMKKDDGVRQGFKDLGSNIIGKDASKERQKQDSQKQAFLKNWKKLTPEQKAKVPNAVRKIYGV
jgi:hypothetical protein